MLKPAEGKHPEDGPELEAGAGAEECAEGLGLEVDEGAGLAAEDMAEEAVVGAASTPAAEAAGEAWAEEAGAGLAKHLRLRAVGSAEAPLREREMRERETSTLKSIVAIEDGRRSLEWTGE
jgi:hypothetical protein